ncbi:MAG: DUF2779 domain-containing protein [Chloroflexi bacterium]|nr:DUF2779 domain-containing protein [Chloroflexota bacterium]
MDNQLTITKSDYQLFLDAPLHLWTHKHRHSDQSPSEFELHTINQGYEVEEEAQIYLEKYVVNAKERESVQFQDTFLDKAFLARTDGLVYKPKSDSYDLYEIKSSTRNKTEFISDAAFQYFILNKHITVDHVYILHLKKDYVRTSVLEIENLFVADDITEKVHAHLSEIEIKREEALKVALSDSSEGIQGCYKPKSCPCLNLCHPDLPDYSIYNIPRISEKKKRQLLEKGIRNIEDVPSAFPLNEKQRKIVDVAIAKKEYIDKAAIQREFEHFEYPLYFLDYESFLAAIPLFDGYHPQQQVVFQYSLHKLDSDQEEPTHSEHLSITKDDPSTSLVKQLREDIGDRGTVFVWNKAFEITRNKELALIHPAYADFFEDLNHRIYDLGDFIADGHYLHPDFFGSWSIKKVLPVMAPELSYKEMEIAKGDQAMMAWWKIISGELPEEHIEKMKRSLLAYCKLDSYAMVAIFMKLSQLTH